MTALSIHSSVPGVSSSIRRIHLARSSQTETYMSYVYSVHHALGELRIVLLSYKDRKGANEGILSDPDLVFEVS